MAAPTVPPPPPALPEPPAGMYPYSYPQAKPKTGQAGAVLTLLGGALVALGALLPWITAVDNYGHTADFSGMAAGARGDGPYVLGFGVIALCFGVARLASSIRPGLQRVPILFAVFAGYAAVVDLNAITQLSYPGVFVSTGPGLFVVLVGAVVTLIGGLVVTRPPFVALKPSVAPKPPVAPTVTKRPLIPWFPAGTEAWVVGLVLVITVAVVLWAGWVVSL